MKQEKLVSIIIPTCNRGLSYLSRAIKSIMWQTYKNYEIIVVDDNSYNSDYSYRIKNYCIKNNITYTKTNGKEGANKARNIGACCAKGSYLAFLDDDDILLPEKLEIQLRYFTKDIGMVYSNGYVVSSNYKQLYTNPKNFISNGNIYKLLIYNYIGPTITGLISTECFFSVGMFDEKMPSKQDYDLWIRITKKFKIIGINQPLFMYMQHDTYQMTKDYNLIMKGYKKIYEKNNDYYKNDCILIFFLYLKFAKIFKCERKYFKYFKCILLAITTLKNGRFNIIF